MEDFSRALRHGVSQSHSKACTKPQLLPWLLALFTIAALPASAQSTLDCGEYGQELLNPANGELSGDWLLADGVFCDLDREAQAMQINSDGELLNEGRMWIGWYGSLTNQGTYNNAGELTIANNAQFDNQLGVFNNNAGGVLNLEIFSFDMTPASGVFNLNNGSTLNNYSSLIAENQSNAGTFNNYERLYVQGEFTNTGTLNLEEGSRLYLDNGILNNGFGGIINLRTDYFEIAPEYGDVVTMSAGSTLNSYFNLEINGAVNAGTLNSQQGSVYTYFVENTGVINNSALFWAEGMTNAGEINNTGEFYFHDIEAFENNGTFNNSGKMLGSYGAGLFNNNGVLNLNAGVDADLGYDSTEINNNAGGTINVLMDYLDVSADYGANIAMNAGSTLNNYAAELTLSNATNAGTLNNEQGAVSTYFFENTGIVNNKASFFSLGMTNTGTINNTGTFYFDYVDTFENDGTFNNSGEMFNLFGDGVFNNNGVLNFNAGSEVNGDYYRAPQFNNNAGGTINLRTYYFEINPYYGGAQVVMNAGSTLNNYTDQGLNIVDTSNAGTLNNESGRIIRGRNLASSGIINNGGLFTGENMSNSGVINNTGEFAISDYGYSDSTFENSGTINNDGRLTGVGDLNNTGVLNLNAGSDLGYGDYVYEAPQVNNNDGGIINVRMDSLEINPYSYSGAGAIAMNAGSTLNNYTEYGLGISGTNNAGTLNNESGRIIAEDFANSGVINNGGLFLSMVMSNSGVINNTGEFTVQEYGFGYETFANSGTFNNDGVLRGIGDFNNTGVLNLNAGSEFGDAYRDPLRINNNDGGIINVRTDFLNIDSYFDDYAVSMNAGSTLNNLTEYGLHIGDTSNAGTLNNESGRVDARSFVNTGVINNGGFFTSEEMSNSGVINNTGEFEVINPGFGAFENSGTFNNDGVLTGVGDFNNSGIVNLNAGSQLGSGDYYHGASAPQLNNNDGGTINVRMEDLVIGPEYLIDNGAVTMNVGSTLNNYTDYGLRILDTNNAGTLNNESGRVNTEHLTNSGVINNGGLFTGQEMSNSGVINNTGEFLLDSYGTFENSGTFNNDGILAGDSVFNNSGVLNLNEGSLLDFYYSNSQINNNDGGTINVGLDEFYIIRNLGNPIAMNTGSTLNNYTEYGLFIAGAENAGTLNNDNEFGFVRAENLVNSGTINNGGQFAGYDMTNSGVINNTGDFFVGSFGEAFENSGTFNNDGTLGGDSAFNNSGVLNLNGGSELDFYYSAAQINNNDGGTINVRLDEFYIDGYSGSPIAMNAGSTLNNHTDYGLFISEATNAGTLNNENEFGFVRAENLVNSGTINNGGQFLAIEMMMNSGVINNTGTFDMDSDGGGFENSGVFNNTGGFFVQGYGYSFENYGVFNNSAALVVRGADYLTNVGVFNNDGSVASDELINNYGDFVIGATGTVTGSGRYRQEAGSTRVDGLLQQESVYIESGVLSGNGTIQADLLDIAASAELGPGNSIGTFTVDGNVNLDGLFVAEIGTFGTADLLEVLGEIDISDGFLEIELIDAYVPMFGDSFDILMAEVIEGRFDVTYLPQLQGSLSWNTLYLENAIGSTDLVRLQVIPVPPAIWLFLSGLGMLGWQQRRRASKTTH